MSTGGTQFHWLDFDAPRIFDSPYRVRAQVIIQRNTNSNYFGLGERAKPDPARARLRRRSARRLRRRPRQLRAGHRTLRGYRQDRFVGSVMTLVNAELRWTFAHAQLAGQRFGFIAAPFFDTGRPYDALDDLTARR